MSRSIGLLSGFLQHLGLADNALSVLHAIDKIEKLSKADFTAELTKAGVSGENIQQIEDLTSLTGTSDAVLQKLAGLGIRNKDFTEGLAQLQQVISALRTMGVPERRFRVDPRIVRGLDYYTGTVYETFLTDYPQIGSVCSGGRYDDLASYYTKTNLSGVGISIGLTRLFYALQKEGVIKPNEQSPAKVIVLPVGEAQNDYAITVARTLRATGIATLLDTESGQLSKKLRYAGRMGFEYVIVLGEREASDQTISLKTMSAHSDQILTPSELIKHLS